MMHWRSIKYALLRHMKYLLIKQKSNSHEKRNIQTRYNFYHWILVITGLQKTVRLTRKIERYKRLPANQCDNLSY